MPCQSQRSGEPVQRLNVSIGSTDDPARAAEERQASDRVRALRLANEREERETEAARFRA